MKAGFLCQKIADSFGLEDANWYVRFLDPDKGQLWLFPNAAHDDLTYTFVIVIQYLGNLIAEVYSARQRAAQEEE